MNLRTFVTSVAVHVRVALRQRLSAFFTFVFPVGMLFLYLGLFYRGDAKMLAFGMAPLLTMTVMANSMFGMTFSLVQHRERGILRQYRLAPLTPTFLVLQNLVVGVVLVLPTIALQLGLAAAVYGFRPSGDWPVAVALLLAGTIAFLGISSVVAAVASNMQQAHILANLLWFPFLFLSGATVPLSVLPGFVQKLAVFLPPTYLVEGLTSAFTTAAPVATYAPHFAALAGTAATGALLAARLFRWDRGDRLPWRARAWGLVVLIPFAGAGAWEVGRGRLIQRFEAQWKEASASPSSLLLVHATLWDGTGAAARVGARILIRNGRIEAVLAADAPKPAADNVLDLGGRFVVPGFVDVSVRLENAVATVPGRSGSLDAVAKRNLAALVRCGVTSVRSVRDDAENLARWSARASRGDWIAPRIIAGDASRLDGQQARVENALATWALARLADAEKRRVWMAEALVVASVPEGTRTLLTSPALFARAAAITGSAGETQTHAPAADAALLIDLRATAQDASRLAIGSSAGEALLFPGAAFHLALGLLAEAGLSPQQILLAATRDGAARLGISRDAGTIEAGKTADLVVLDADPLADVRNAAKIHGVLRAGVVVDLDALTASLDE